MATAITILSPTFDSYLGVSDSTDLSTTLSTVALNYTHGQGRHEAAAGNMAWLCAATNNGATTANLTATANCCRVSGR